MKFYLKDEDYAEIVDGGCTMIRIEKFSIYIEKTDDGVLVDVCAKGCEDCDYLARTHVYDSAAEEMQKAVADEGD